MYSYEKFQSPGGDFFDPDLSTSVFSSSNELGFSPLAGIFLIQTP